MRFRKGSHSIYHTEYHVVLTPRYRRKLFVKGVKEYLEKMLMKLENLDPDIEVMKVNVQLDHVHMVAIIPPRLAVANVIGFIASQTGKRLREKFPFIREAIRRGGGIWSRGYCVSTVGMNEKAILAYVEHQGREDTGQLELDFDL